MSDSRTRRERSTSWDGVAEWYDGWMGDAGDGHHRNNLIPHLLELLGLRPGERLLDVGCGQGVLAPHARRLGALYVGVDLSPRLISHARRRHGSEGEFRTGDACDLLATSSLQPGSFDAAAFLVSIQDMEPLKAVLDSTGRMLGQGGRVAIVTTHPAFQVPRQSGWGWDKKRKLRFRRVDSYLTPFAAPLPPRRGRSRAQTLRRFHRPVGDYINGLIAAGFEVRRVTEVPAHRGNGPPEERRAVERSRLEVPLFLGLLAFKK